MKNLTLVGGSHDGSRIAIPSDLATHELRMVKKFSRGVFDVALEREIYTPRRFAVGSEVLESLYALEGMSDTEVMQRLIDRYAS